MAGRLIQLTLNISHRSHVDIEELADLTYQLREELMGMDVKAVDLVHMGKVPEDAKAGDPVSWGTLLVTLAASGGVFTTLMTSLHAWLTRHERRRITLEIGQDKLEVTGISSEEQQRLISAWINRHTAAVSTDD